LIRRGDGTANPALQQTFDKAKASVQTNYDRLSNIKSTIDTIVLALNIPSPTADDIQKYQPKSTSQLKVKNILLQQLKNTSLQDNITGRTQLLQRSA